MPAIRSFPLKCVLSIVSGAIYASSFPPVGWGWLVFPSIALFLIVLRGESGSRARALGFLHGITAFGIGLSWLVQLFGPAALALWTVLAVFPALFAHFQGAAEKKGITRWKFAIFTTLNWCGWEWIRAEVFSAEVSMDDFRARDGTECAAAVDRCLWGGAVRDFRNRLGRRGIVQIVRRLCCGACLNAAFCFACGGS
jgi:hypothetical protein